VSDALWEGLAETVAQVSNGNNLYTRHERQRFSGRWPMFISSC